uniref:Uncharacterized protein n=1 Tax=Arundo donax TaxID=35708 RepID=A0A0A9C904_ARUDO
MLQVKGAKNDGRRGEERSVLRMLVRNKGQDPSESRSMTHLS